MPNRLSSGNHGTEREGTTAMQDNVRTMLQEVQTPVASSVYSGTPHPEFANIGRHQSSRSPIRNDFGPLRGYDGTNFQPGRPTSPVSLDLPAPQLNYSPLSQHGEWPHLPDEPLPAHQSTFRHPADSVPTAGEQDRDLEAAIPVIRAKRRGSRKRRRQQRRDVWTRSHGRTESGTCAPLMKGSMRSKYMACIISGLFLASVLTIYLSIALTLKNLGQELHVLFILIIVGTTIFFAHSLIRLCLMAKRPRNALNDSGGRQITTNMAGPEGFNPDVPIPVQLARDEELAQQMEADGAMDNVEKAEDVVIKPPPPAYGLWRSSVRINPDLLHWQKVANGETHSATNAAKDDALPAVNAASPVLEAVEESQPRTQPRPPSYISDDGISYVVSALPPRPPSEIHPAFRIRLP